MKLIKKILKKCNNKDGVELPYQILKCYEVRIIKIAWCNYPWIDKTVEQKRESRKNQMHQNFTPQRLFQMNSEKNWF